uniref:Activin_recp domain-containing protein n=1 Tax=Globodera pallida TaxID=36090 RepID=A0A183C1H8_GLOPA
MFICYSVLLHCCSGITCRRGIQLGEYRDTTSHKCTEQYMYCSKAICETKDEANQTLVLYGCVDAASATDSACTQMVKNSAKLKKLRNNLDLDKLACRCEIKQNKILNANPHQFAPLPPFESEIVVALKLPRTTSTPKTADTHPYFGIMLEKVTLLAKSQAASVRPSVALSCFLTMLLMTFSGISTFFHIDLR